MKIYECETHDENFQKGAKEGCTCCIRLLKIIAQNKEAHSKLPKLPRLRMSVYWGKADELSSGRVIENLEHRPVHFRNKDQFRNYLKEHRVAEAG